MNSQKCSNRAYATPISTLSTPPHSSLRQPGLLLRAGFLSFLSHDRPLPDRHPHERAFDAAYCGAIGDNCGGALSCPACASGFVCTSGVCLGDANCKRLTCITADGGHYCGGTLGDGCGSCHVRRQ